MPNALDLITFSRASNATVIDSDGVLKWAPHNYVRNSHDLDSWVTKTNAVVSGDTVTFSTTNSSIGNTTDYPDGVITAKVSVGTTSGHTWVRFITKGASTWFNIQTGAVGTTQHETAEAVADNDGFLLTVTDTTTSGASEFTLTAADGNGSVAEVDGAVLVIRKPRLYRSDLGGMQNDWVSGTDYVENTTASPLYKARINHEPDGTVKGLLLEKGSANQFSNNSWAGFATGDANQTVGNVVFTGSKNGITANILSFGTENGIPYAEIRYSGTETSGGTQFFDIADTASVPAADGDKFAISAYLSLVAGTVPEDSIIQLYNHGRDSSAGSVDLTAVRVGDEVAAVGSTLTRITRVKTMTGAAITQVVNKGFFVRVPGSATVDFTIRVGLIQHETGSVPTSVIPTTGSTASRADDQAYINTSDFGYNPKVGTVVCEIEDWKFEEGGPGYPRGWEIGSASTNANRIMLFLTESVNNCSLEVRTNDSGVNTAGKAVTSPFNIKSAAAFRNGDSGHSVDGGAVATNAHTTTWPPSAPRTKLSLGGTTTGAVSTNLHIKSLKYYPRHLSDAQLQELSS